VKTIDAKLTISYPSTGGVCIKVTDTLSSTAFVEISISHEEFSRALSSLSHRPCTAEVKGLDHVGMKLVREDRQARCPHGFLTREQAESWLLENAQEPGWQMDPYLGSQRSRVSHSGGLILNYAVFKYIDPEAP
jgi:hypothetical protein